MANSVKEPFDSPDWVFEVKLDSYRAIAVSMLPASLVSGRVTGYHWNKNFQPPENSMTRKPLYRPDVNLWAALDNPCAGQVTRNS